MAETGKCCSTVIIRPSFSKGSQANPTAETAKEQRLTHPQRSAFCAILLRLSAPWPQLTPREVNPEAGNCPLASASLGPPSLTQTKSPQQSQWLKFSHKPMAPTETFSGSDRANSLCVDLMPRDKLPSSELCLSKNCRHRGAQFNRTSTWKVTQTRVAGSGSNPALTSHFTPMGCPVAVRGLLMQAKVRLCRRVCRTEAVVCTLQD